MNKKILLLTGIIFFSGLFVIIQSRSFKSDVSINNPESPARIAENIIKNDQEALEKNFNPAILQDKSWADINNYSKSPKDLINKDNSKNLFKIANGSIGDLASCLKKDFCGMKKRNENDAYFDKNKTPGHILLGRNLNIMYYALLQHPQLQKDIDWELLFELTDNDNEQVQVMAVKLIREFGRADTESLLKTVDKYKGAAKADALLEIKTLNFSKERELLVNSLEKYFSIDDPNTVISIVERLGKMNLTPEELSKVSQNLCHYKENGVENPNWKMIRHDMKKVNVNLDSICTN